MYRSGWDERNRVEAGPAYVVDTMALAYHLQDRLPEEAGKAFEEAEASNGRVFVPEIVLGEFVYLALKGRFNLQEPKREVKLIMSYIYNEEFLAPLSMNELAWRIYLTLNIPELHDRMIAACAQSYGLPIITNDPHLTAEPRLATIW